MAILPADIGTGSTYTFAGYVTEILSMDWSGISREAIGTSHLASTVSTATNFGSMTFIAAALEDPGEVTFEVNFNPDVANPIRLPEATLTVTFNSTSQGTDATWAGTAFCTGYTASVPLEGVMTASATFKFTGLITQTASST